MVETIFPTHAGPLPVVDTPDMIEVDRAMIEDYRIDLIQMMENAGRNLAHPSPTFPAKCYPGIACDKLNRAGFAGGSQP